MIAFIIFTIAARNKLGKKNANTQQERSAGKCDVLAIDYMLMMLMSTSGNDDAALIAAQAVPGLDSSNSPSR